MPASENASYFAFGSLRSAKLQRLGWHPVPEQHCHALERKESISPILKLILRGNGWVGVLRYLFPHGICRVSLGMVAHPE